MTIDSFDKLIKELPVDFQSFTTNRATWKKFEEVNQLVYNYNNHIFQEKKLLTISREELFSSTLDIATFLLKTIYWGYLAGMRGNNFKRITEQARFNHFAGVLKEIQIKSNITQANFIEYLSLVPVGISTFSKLLYFMEIKIEQLPCLILDRQLIQVFNNQLFYELTPLSTISYPNAKFFYHKYLKLIYSISHKRYRADKLECFLYIFGNNLKFPSQNSHL